MMNGLNRQKIAEYRHSAYLEDRLSSRLFMQEHTRYAPNSEYKQPHWVGRGPGRYIVGGLSDGDMCFELG